MQTEPNSIKALLIKDVISKRYRLSFEKYVMGKNLLPTLYSKNVITPESQFIK